MTWTDQISPHLEARYLNSQYTHISHWLFIVCTFALSCNSTPNDNDLTSVNRSTFRDGVRKLGRVRGQRVSPSPLPKARSKERLPSISPDQGHDRESPTFSRNGKYRRSFDEAKTGLGKGNKPGINWKLSSFVYQKEQKRTV